MFYQQFLNLGTPSKQPFLAAAHPEVFTSLLFALAAFTGGIALWVGESCSHFSHPAAEQSQGPLALLMSWKRVMKLIIVCQLP